jgi:hypothetical protein
MTRELSVGDELPNFAFDAGNGTEWSTDEHRAAGTALVLILHRHLA